jgi:hypothetical protein
MFNKLTLLNNSPKKWSESKFSIISKKNYCTYNKFWERPNYLEYRKNELYIFHNQRFYLNPCKKVLYTTQIWNNNEIYWYFVFSNLIIFLWQFDQNSPQPTGITKAMFLFKNEEGNWFNLGNIINSSHELNRIGPYNFQICIDTWITEIEKKYERDFVHTNELSIVIYSKVLTTFPLQIKRNIKFTEVNLNNTWFF